MKRAYKWVAFALCFALILLMGVEVVPLQDRAIVVGLAIDADEEGYSVAAQILMPSDDDSKSSGYIISEARSETLSGALTKISEQSNLIVAMSHCNLVILGKGVIDRGAYYSLDYLIRNAYLSENALLLAAEGRAADILSAKTAYSETSSFYIQRALMEFGYYNDRTVRTIREFIVSHYTYNKANWLPIVTKRVAQSEEKPGTSGGGTESPEGGGEEQYVFDFSTTAVFRDGKYRFTLSQEGTTGLAYVNSVIEEGSVTVTDPKTLTISPYDRSTLKAMVKAILASDIGITPTDDGSVIRLVFPQLTEEHRKTLAKQIQKMSEDARVAVRNIRREANDEVKKLKKDGEMTEDEQKASEKSVQELTDRYIKQIDEITAAKEKEIMQI